MTLQLKSSVYCLKVSRFVEGDFPNFHVRSKAWKKMLSKLLRLQKLNVLPEAAMKRPQGEIRPQ